MKIVIDGKTAEVQVGGPAGPDGNPIGTIISYMGLTAPKDYLACDGAIYNISDYSSLAQHFREQFGSENYFGGDGTTTFAVPDMRNLFLRGFHGEGIEQLSGDVGVKQEGTIIPTLTVGGSSSTVCIGTVNDAAPGKPVTKPENVDKIMGTANTWGVNNTEDYPATEGTGFTSSYTSRPVNMAVLYCIKAT